MQTTKPLSGGAKENRTPALLLARQALYQLSYGPICGDSMESWTPVSSVTGLYSNRWTTEPFWCRFYCYSSVPSTGFTIYGLTEATNLLMTRIFGAVHRIRTCKPFQANCFQGSSLTNPDRRHIIGSATQNWTGDSTVKGWWLDHLPIAPYLFFVFLFSFYNNYTIILK